MNSSLNRNGNAIDSKWETLSERQSTPLEREILAQILPLLEEKVSLYVREQLEKKLWQLLPHLAEEYLRKELQAVTIVGDSRD